MMQLVLMPTTLCNLNCVHCMVDKTTAKSIPLDLVESVLKQAKDLGIREVCLTGGGEPTMYPHLEELVESIVHYGLRFNLVTNGLRFRDRLLPLILRPEVRRSLAGVCFSLDGASPRSHDAIRGSGSFEKVMEAAGLCKLKKIEISLKTVITNFNKYELLDVALLGATLGARSHGFLCPFPTPRLIKEGVIPTPGELRRLVSWIAKSLMPAVKTKIHIEGYLPDSAVFTCNMFCSISVDEQGNQVLCCNLSHVVDDGRPAAMGREFVADLKKVPLRDGVARHFQLLSEVMAARMRDAERLRGLTYLPCYWCYKYHGKLEWLKNYPESPWAEGVLSG